MIIELGERPFTCCCVTPDETTLIAGDTVGRVSRVDLRTLRLTGVYKGNTGSIREIAVHPSMNVIATVGLDRIMRVFDVETRQQLHRVYLRQRLNCVLFSGEESVQCFAKEEEEEEVKEESDDSLLHEDEEEEESDDSILHDDEQEEESDDSLLHDDEEEEDSSSE